MKTKRRGHERRVVRVGRVLAHGLFTTVLAVFAATIVLVALAVAFVFVVD